MLNTKGNLEKIMTDLGVSRRPLTAGVESTNLCSANCSFCGYGKKLDRFYGDPRRKKKLPEDVLNKTLDLYDMVGGGGFHIGPILGENTSNPRWLDYIRAARQRKNIKAISSFTNAILLDNFDIEEIFQSGITNLDISTCLSSREQYKRLYGVDKYDRVVKNILELLESNHKRGRPINIYIHLRMDKPYSIFFESLLYKRIINLIPSGNIDVLTEGWDDFRGLISKQGLPKGHELKKNLPIQAKQKPCYALFRKLQVLVDGTIQACSCRIEPELWAGNILDYESFQEAWRNEKLDKLRSDWLSGNIPNCCVQCTHYIPYTNLQQSIVKKFKRVAKRMIGKIAEF